ncbi:MAG TPA: HAD family hydrolase [Candidatus Limnocylindria bacterium]
MTSVVFLDVYGVLMDPAPLAAQWERLVGDFLAPRLGGDPSRWGAANRYAADRMFARYRDPKGTPGETHARLRRLWFREMCEHAGVDPPKRPGPLADETFAWVGERLQATFPGTVDALREIARRGHRLFTSAGLVSTDGDAFLRGIGVRDLFVEVYGTDVIDRWKTNAGFYRKILEHSGVSGAEAVTVDDQERCLDWAKRAGFARTFLLAPAGTASNHETIASLAELVERLEPR